MDLPKNSPLIQTNFKIYNGQRKTLAELSNIWPVQMQNNYYLQQNFCQQIHTAPANLMMSMPSFDQSYLKQNIGFYLPQNSTNDFFPQLPQHFNKELINQPINSNNSRSLYDLHQQPTFKCPYSAVVKAHLPNKSKNNDEKDQNNSKAKIKSDCPEKENVNLHQVIWQNENPTKDLNSSSYLSKNNNNNKPAEKANFYLADSFPNKSYFPEKDNTKPQQDCKVSRRDMFYLPEKDNKLQTNWRNTNNNDSGESNKFFNEGNKQNNSIQILSKPVDLIVTNIDNLINQNEIMKILDKSFKEYVRVLKISSYYQYDGSLGVLVKVQNNQDAQYAISQMHHRRIGHKKISISYAKDLNNHNENFIQLRTQVFSLLKTMPGKKISLFNFRQIYSNHFNSTISIGDLHKMKDICQITDDRSLGKVISFVENQNNNQSNTLLSALNITQNARSRSHSPNSPNSIDENLELTFCERHSKNMNNNNNTPIIMKNWAMQAMGELLSIKIDLKTFAFKIYTLLKSHNGYLPMLSFQVCYESDLNELLPIDDTNGVPLEHLVTCIPGVELCQTHSKYLKWSNKEEQQKSIDEIFAELSFSTDLLQADTSMKNSPPARLQTLFQLFSRELIELLKATPNCRIQHKNFISAYYNHFGRQCRVADYGFTKLSELFDALSHIVQVIGEGTKRQITLTHRAQIRRFASDVNRIMRLCITHEVTLKQFEEMAEKVLKMNYFSPINYGLCHTKDLFMCLPENTIVIRNKDGSNNLDDISMEDILISLPKKEQTYQEIQNTKKFIKDCIELLSNVPNFSILFDRFVPTYHHYFNEQCKVNDYGFTKLIELFKHIPHIVKIEELPSGDKMLKLTYEESLKIFKKQMNVILNEFEETDSIVQIIPLNQICKAYISKYEYPISPDIFGLNNLSELFELIVNDSIQIVNDTWNNYYLRILNESTRVFGLKIWSIMMHTPFYQIRLSNLKELYEIIFNETLSLSDMFKIRYLIDINLNQFPLKLGLDDEQSQLDRTEIELNSLYIYACKIFAHVVFKEETDFGLVEIFFNQLYDQIQVPLYNDSDDKQFLDVISIYLSDIFLIDSNGLKVNQKFYTDVENSHVQTFDFKTYQERKFFIENFCIKKELDEIKNPRVFLVPKPDTPIKISDLNKENLYVVYSPPKPYKNLEIDLKINTIPIRDMGPLFNSPLESYQNYQTPPSSSSSIENDSSIKEQNTKTIQQFHRTPGHGRRRKKTRLLF